MVVDVVMLVLLAWAAIRGWRQGLVVRGLQLLGFVGAGALAYHYLPTWLTHVNALARPGIARSIALIAGVWLAASIGELVLGRVGLRLMDGRHGAAPDRLLGSLASMLVTTFVAWFVVTAASPAFSATVGRAVGQSRILAAVDRVAPEAPRRWAADLATSINENRFPTVFNSLSPDPVPSVSAPSQGVTSSSGVQKAAASIVKVLSDSASCGGSEGSGWVVASHHVVTNAHVVAGATSVTVQVGGVGRQLPATVVGFDSRTDLAILDVPQLTAPALTRDEDALSTGTSTAVAGFPLDGSYKVVAARIREEMDATGRDIYSTRLVTRTVYSLYTTVQPGNSGGPLLTSTGEVAGTVFARSTTDSSTGYALSDAATASLLDKAASLTTAVSTQSCVAG